MILLKVKKLISTLDNGDTFVITKINIPWNFFYNGSLYNTCIHMTMQAFIDSQNTGSAPVFVLTIPVSVLIFPRWEMKTLVSRLSDIDITSSLSSTEQL